MNSNKILIVGGGSAGWMTAATLIKAYPDRDITLLESKQIQKIGVGESTNAGLPAWLSLLDIDYKDFMAYTDAAYKLSIKFTDFHSIGDNGFHYPFGHPTLQNFKTNPPGDWHFLKLIEPETTRQSYVNSIFPSSVLIDTNKMYFPKNTYEMDGFSMKRDFALQFDAIKFASWLKERYAMPRGVKHIEADVVKVNTDDDGVSSIVLSDGTELSADIYIDCTGFKGLLIKEALQTPFESHAEQLPINRTWAVQLPYEDPDREVVNYTNCTALGYGWVWNAPLYSRIGTGYVYSDRFTTPEDALEEFKEHLRKEHGAHRITDDLKFRDIPFESGVVSKPWNKNVAAIGLSGFFLEPLESTGLMFIHQFAVMLTKMIMNPVINKFDQEAYNFEVKRTINNYSAFVQLHYLLSSRRDTEFWRYMTSRDVLPKTRNDANMTTFLAEIRGKLNTQNFAISILEGFHCIAVGHEWYPISPLSLNEVKYNTPSIDPVEIARSFKSNSEQLRAKWFNVIKDAPTHYQFLKENYHSAKSDQELPL
jgi:flavin-dependent dehydrogenase